MIALYIYIKKEEEEDEQKKKNEQPNILNPWSSSF